VGPDGHLEACRLLISDELEALSEKTRVYIGSDGFSLLSGEPYVFLVGHDGESDRSKVSVWDIESGGGSADYKSLPYCMILCRPAMGSRRNATTNRVAWPILACLSTAIAKTEPGWQDKSVRFDAPRRTPTRPHDGPDGAGLRPRVSHESSVRLR
jgi:hypothetical protein